MHSLAHKLFLGDPYFAKPPTMPLGDDAIVDVTRQWMTSSLPCIAGRRETLKDRYMVAVATQATVPDLFKQFRHRLEKGQAIACLYVFNSWEHMNPAMSVSEVFYFLAEQMQKISKVSAHDLANGQALTNKLKLVCPITETLTTYDDFECIAFCPQSNNPDDPLYDPLLAMPVPAVNMSSDMFAFSNFVADMIRQRYKKSVVELSKDRKETEKALYHCVAQWQRIAAKTIQNYEALTDTSLCPVHLNAKQDQWVAGHKDPAFAEQVKEVHTHELPTLYGTRIVSEWLDFFYNQKIYSASGLARDGILLD